MCTSLEHQAARKHAGLVLVALALISVSAARLGFRCPFRAVLGIDCPGCGGTRAWALLRGDVRQAARENLAVVVAGTAAAGYEIAPGAGRPGGSRHQVAGRALRGDQVVGAAATTGRLRRHHPVGRGQELPVAATLQRPP